MALRHVATLTCGDGKLTVEILQGDITEVEGVDAIVNPANSLMIMGGGVAGAIRRKGGEEIEREARKYAPVPVGKAVVTSAGKLQPRIRYVIHAPTMERPAMRTTADKVYRAALAALELAEARGFNTIALPALGAGVGGVPVEESVKKIMEAIEEKLDTFKNLKKVMLVAYTETDAKKFLEGIREHTRKKTAKCKLIEVKTET